MVLLLGLVPARAVVLYSTEFNNPPFAAGNYWAGIDGWLSSDPSNGSMAVTTEGGAAYLGAVAPAAAIASAARNFRYDPVAGGLPIVRITTKIGVVDSTTNKFDAFALALYDTTGSLLGALVLDNATLGLSYNNGTSYSALPGRFPNAQYFRLTWTIDFSTNLASIIVTDAAGSVHPLLVNRTFHAAGRPLNLGDFEFLWLVNSSGTAGDNYLVVDSFSVEAFPVASLSIDKGSHHRTRSSGYTLRGSQAAEDVVTVQARVAGKRRWAAVKGSPARWSFKVKRLKPGRNIVQVRLLNALAAVIDQEKIVIMRK